jgi:hypothetical protein
MVGHSFVAGARLLGPGRLLMPGVHELLASLARDLAAMLAPLQAADNEADRCFGARVALRVCEFQYLNAYRDWLSRTELDFVGICGHPNRPAGLRTTLLKRANERVLVDESGDNGPMVCPLIFGNAGATAADPILSLLPLVPMREILSQSEIPGQCVMAKSAW